MPLFQPRYTGLEDALGDIDIETDEGDIGDNLDNAVDEDDINALIETNSNVKKKFYFAF